MEVLSIERIINLIRWLASIFGWKPESKEMEINIVKIFLNNYCFTNGVLEVANFVGEITLHAIIISSTKEIQKLNPAQYSGEKIVIFNQIVDSIILPKIISMTPETQAEDFPSLKDPKRLTLFREQISRSILKFILKEVIPNNKLIRF